MDHEIREAAMAYFVNLPRSKKQQAYEFFRSLDSNGDGKINVHEYRAALNRMGITSMNNLGFFKELDKNGNGTLDFEERSSREFISHVLFASTLAPLPSNLCCSCYRNNEFNHHHDHTNFVDNYVLLQSKWRPTSSTPSPSQTTQEPPREQTPPPTNVSFTTTAMQAASTAHMF
ncbi:Calcium-binding EF-hand [Corchorus capsularis]|uniref:Calcium-binding EF-hand n=1 Tax=Corchorus capsularis TaxID=210143 RepID=A0A1R3HF79_COCAP|nr:Calcium-binding EF-hand [Corchorus capsularis]